MKQRIRPAQILWLGLLASTLALVGVVFVVQQPPHPPPPFMFPALAGLALGVAVISVVLPAQMMRRVLSAQLTPLVAERANPAAEVTFREAAPPIKVFDDPRAAWTKAVVAYQTPLILSLALAESVGLFGVILPVQGFPRVTALPFLAGCLALQIARFPTAAKLAGAVKAATGVELPLED